VEHVEAAEPVDGAADRRSQAVGVGHVGTDRDRILTPADRISADKRRTTVAWSSLRFEGKPTPHFLTSLSPQELAAGTSFKRQAESRDDFYEVKTDLLGKSVTILIQRAARVPSAPA
jgi:hypothetical protein